MQNLPGLLQATASSPLDGRNVFGSLEGGLEPERQQRLRSCCFCAGTPVQNLPGPLQVTASSPLDGPTVSGSEISLVVGTRIATPFFGTGFNFCVGVHPHPLL